MKLTSFFISLFIGYIIIDINVFVMVKEMKFSMQAKGDLRTHLHASFFLRKFFLGLMSSIFAMSVYQLRKFKMNDLYATMLSVVVIYFYVSQIAHLEDSLLMGDIDNEDAWFICNRYMAILVISFLQLILYSENDISGLFLSVFGGMMLRSNIVDVPFILGYQDSSFFIMNSCFHLNTWLFTTFQRIIFIFVSFELIKNFYHNRKRHYLIVLALLLFSILLIYTGIEPAERIMCHRRRLPTDYQLLTIIFGRASLFSATLTSLIIISKKV